MKPRDVIVCATLILLPASAAVPQTLPAPATRQPDFTVQIWGDAVADFSARVRTYAERRTTLEVGLPPLTLTADPAEILRAERALARRLRHVEEGVELGSIFSPGIAAAFRTALGPEVDAETMIAILDENPGRFSHRAYGTYPKEHTVSTVPANLLAVLPELPADIQYRFLGRDLVLHDTRANVIVDRMPCAVSCAR